MVADCPRCGAIRCGFEVRGNSKVAGRMNIDGSKDGNVVWEVYALCMACRQGAIFLMRPTDYVLSLGGAVEPPTRSSYGYEVLQYVPIRDSRPTRPPEHLTAEVKAVFEEAAQCRAVGCPNAAGAMFRLCLELAVRELLPKQEDWKKRLAEKLKQLFAEGKLPKDIEPLSSDIREDGNDAAHHGTLDAGAAEDMEDLTVEVLRRAFTETGRAKAAQARRDRRRQAQKKKAGPR